MKLEQKNPISTTKNSENFKYDTDKKAFLKVINDFRNRIVQVWSSDPYLLAEMNYTKKFTNDVEIIEKILQAIDVAFERLLINVDNIKSLNNFGDYLQIKINSLITSLHEKSALGVKFDSADDMDDILHEMEDVIQKRIKELKLFHSDILDSDKLPRFENFFEIEYRLINNLKIKLNKLTAGVFSSTDAKDIEKSLKTIFSISQSLWRDLDEKKVDLPRIQLRIIKALSYLFFDGKKGLVKNQYNAKIVKEIFLTLKTFFREYEGVRRKKGEN